MSKEQTKVALLEAGKRIFLERGYTASGIEAIVHAAGVPKGSFYYYFSSKEDFGLRVLEHFATTYGAMLDQALGDPTVGPLERLRRHIEGVVGRLESHGCRDGCLVGALSQEMANQNEAFRVRVEEIFGRWVDRIAGCLRQAQEEGELPGHLDVRQLAEFWLNSWQGAILRAKITRGPAPLRTFLEVIFGDVLQRA